MKSTKPLHEQIFENIRARSALIFIETVEDSETLDTLKQLCLDQKWNLIGAEPGRLYANLLPEQSNPMAIAPNDEPTDLPAWVGMVREYPNPAVFVLRDLGAFLNDRLDPLALATMVRMLKQLKEHLRTCHKSIVVLGRQFHVPAELCDDFVQLRQPRPNRERLKVLIHEFAAAYPERVTEDLQIQEHLIDASGGLTVEQTRTCFAKAITSKGSLDAAAIAYVLEQKKEIIQRNGMLEFIDGDNTIDSVGGLDSLKDWLRKRKRAFISQGEAVDLPVPKGILVFGVPGGGKSLTAKAVQSLWQIPLLRFDMGKIFARYVGESENNLREVLRVIEAISPCVLWIDEMEKGFAGASGGHETTTRVLGSFLTWMQEKTCKVFVIATANDITQIPAEFTRKGRFDDLFFVEPPTTEERESIFRIQLQRQGVFESLEPEIQTLVNQSQDYTGAEIENAIIEARYNAFDADSPITVQFVIEALRRSKPVWLRFKKVMAQERYKEIIEESRRASRSAQSATAVTPRF